MSHLTPQESILEFFLQIYFHLFIILPAAYLCFHTAGRDKLCRSPQKIALTAVLATLLYAFIYFPLWYFLGAGNALTLIPFASIAFFYYRRVTEENTLILLFIFLCSILYTKTNLALFLAVDRWFFPPSDHVLLEDLWRPVDMIFAAGFTVVTLPAASWLMQKKIGPLFNRARGGESILLWILPTAFIIFFAIEGTQDIDDWTSGTFYSFLIIIAVISTLQSLAVMRQSQKSAQKETELRQVDAQLRQQSERYAELVDYNSQVRVLRHDMRHHLLALEGMLYEQHYEEAKAYLKEYGAAVEPQEGPPLCENRVADVIARHYQKKAGELGVKTDFILILPQECGVADSDLCIILGNLLENAVNACALVQQDAFIRMRVKPEGMELLIAVDNSCIRAVGRENSGLGIPSVRAVADNYHGLTDIKRNGNLFEASVILPCAKK